jgi:hypothetical protein
MVFWHPCLNWRWWNNSRQTILTAVEGRKLSYADEWEKNYSVSLDDAYGKDTDGHKLSSKVIRNSVNQPKPLSTSLTISNIQTEILTDN